MIFIGNTSLDIHLHDTMFVNSYWTLIQVAVIFLALIISVNFLFPRIFGRQLNQPLGQMHFWLTVMGLSVCLLGVQNFNN
jgi:cytochrome c oxidase subunit 1